MILFYKWFDHYSGMLRSIIKISLVPLVNILSLSIFQGEGGINFPEHIICSRFLL